MNYDDVRTLRVWDIYVSIACMLYGKNVYFENCETTNAANRFVYVTDSNRIRSTYKSNLILNNNALKTLAVKRIY